MNRAGGKHSQHLSGHITQSNQKLRYVSVPGCCISKSDLDLPLFFFYLSHLLVISFIFTAGRERATVFCVRRCTQPAVKPQRSTGICKVSCSGFAIRCKTLTDLPRQGQKKTQTSWETSLAVYRRLSPLNTDNVSASKKSRAGDGKGEKEYLAEEISGNKQ